MKRADKYASIPAEYRDHVLRALRKPASKRTEHDRKAIELADKWLAIHKERVELEAKLEAKLEIQKARVRALNALKAKVEEAKKDMERVKTENQHFTRTRLNFWERQAREKLAADGWTYAESSSPWKRDDCSQSERPNLPAAELLESILFTRKVIADGIVENGVLRGLGLASALINNGHKHFLNDAVRYANRTYSQKPRSKPLLGTRAIAIAWEEGHRDTASIRGFFNEWRGRFKDDEWGGLSLDAADDFAGWGLIDEGAKAGKDGEKPTKKIKDASLASMVSRFKKDRAQIR